MSTKSPTIKRILKEAAELASQPSNDYSAAPLDNDLFEWHFTIRGPPSPSPYADGLYHGRIVLPPAYPLKPPSFRFLTPTGRFEVNREICLSISGHHEETWQPAWGIRTALVAIRSFMDTDAKGQLGGMDASEEVRKRFAGQSRGFRCMTCGGKTNEEIMRDQEEAVKAAGGEDKKTEEVPGELRLAYREDLSKEKGKEEAVSQAPAISSSAAGPNPPVAAPSASVPTGSIAPNSTAELPQRTLPAQGLPQPAAALAQRQRPRPDDGVPAWVDKTIYGVLAALAFLICKKVFL